MKKTLLILPLVVLVGLMIGVAQAYAAVPSINGSVVLGEWDNVPVTTVGGYFYHLDISDVNEGGITDNYDIQRAVVLQHLDYYNPGAVPLPSNDTNVANDGVYVLIQTYATPSLVDANGFGTRASVVLFADFNGDGTPSAAGGGYPADIQLYIINVADPLNPTTSDRVYLCTGPGSCDSTGLLIWDGGANINTPTGFQYARGVDGIEMFLKTGTFGTPDHGPFPISFVGEATYDDGTDNPDDSAKGTNAVIPEPASMIMLGMGLLGLAGYKKFGSK